MLLAGKITGAYGIRGWVKVHPFTDTPESFLEFGQWTLKRTSPRDGASGDNAAAPSRRSAAQEKHTRKQQAVSTGHVPRSGAARDAERRVHFAEGRRHGKGLIARIEGVDDRDEAEALRGAEVWVSDDALPELEQGEYYWHELQGLEVRCDHEGSEFLLGVVDHLLETGANDVLVLKPCEGSLDQRERLIPFVEGDVITLIAPQEGLIRVAWHPDD